ncbi:MAG: hypothetical protein WA869_30450, partial [Alloacidobacterium sp.]
PYLILTRGMLPPTFVSSYVNYQQLSPLYPRDVQITSVALIVPQLNDQAHLTPQFAEHDNNQNQFWVRYRFPRSSR